MVGAGQLDVYVMIQEQTDPNAVPSSYTDATGGEIWINLRPLQGRERYLAQAINGRITHKATCRYWPGLTGAHRLKRKDNGRIAAGGRARRMVRDRRV
jgi:head-tail adaptor